MYHQYPGTTEFAKGQGVRQQPVQRTSASLRSGSGSAKIGRRFAQTLLALTITATLLGNAAATGETALPTYQRVSGVSGNLSSIGSDTLANLITLWTEAFKREYPNVNVQVQAAGSSTAPTALTQGTSNLGPMSRRMNNSELQAFERKHGYKPLSVRVALDALAIYVHKDNPLKSISIEQLDAIFSATRRCGGARDITTWGELGLTGSWMNRPIQLHGRNSVSGTYGYFKSAALCHGDFKNTASEQPGSASVVQAVTSSLNGIGYSGIGYETPGVRTVAISRRADTQAVQASFENAINRSYPLARFLYVYVNKRPGTPLALLETEFLKLALSDEGQQVVKKDGYIPLPVATVEDELAKLL